MLEKGVPRLWRSRLGFAARRERCWQSPSEMEVAWLCVDWKTCHWWKRHEVIAHVENLPLDQAMCIHDYSEGYACWFQDEIQCQYFDGCEQSKSSWREEPANCKEHLLVISVGIIQNHDSVLHIQKLSAKYLEESNYTIKEMHEFTNGCAGLFKGWNCYGDLMTVPWQWSLGYTVQKNFFATSHA